MRRFLDFLRKGFVICFGILIACVALEALLQVTDQMDYDHLANDPKTGLLLYKPNSSFNYLQSCYSNTVVINSMGFHAPEPPPQNKKPSEFRIEIVGSSFVEANQMPVDDLASSRLEALLNERAGSPYHYEVIPIAFSGNGTYLDALYYLAYGRPLKPDLVINLTTEYEHTRPSPSDSYFDEKGDLKTVPPKLVSTSLTTKVKAALRYSKLIMNVYNRLLVLKAYARASTAEVATDSAEYKEAQWHIDSELMSVFSKSVKDDNAHFMIASWAVPQSETMPGDLSAHLQKDAQVGGYSYFDMSPSIAAQEVSAGEPAQFSCDAHWSPAGDNYAAHALYEYLFAHPKLITKV